MTYSNALECLGGDLISPDMIAERCGSVNYTPHQHQMFQTTVPDDDTLDLCKRLRMVLVAGPHRPMSLGDFQHSGARQLKFVPNGFYVGDPNQNFVVADVVTPRWIALQKWPLESSFGTMWAQQIGLVTAPLTVLNVAEVAWIMMMATAVKGMYLLPRIHVRTASQSRYGNHILVGDMSSGGPSITDRLNDDPDRGTGIACALRL